jgi:hypothetical protein
MNHREKLFIRKTKRRRGPTRLHPERAAEYPSKSQPQTSSERIDPPRQTGCNLVDLASHRLRSNQQPVSYYFVDPPDGHAGYFGFVSMPSIGDRVVLEGRYAHGYRVSSIVHQTSKSGSRFDPFIVIRLCYATKLKRRRPLRPK